ncbi:MAG: aminotransferase class I/II-fold pyridoxal phosphate-dependent enzyme, partial [Geovibrio sp.]|nr:aminotransferase class I/II-fold pyridoxal phosphate-dependent enzyme [Geovibrio sp.]
MPHRQETIAVRGGYKPEEHNGSITVPIYQTNAYQFRDIEHARNLFDLKEFGHIYTRITNPTTAVLEERLCQLEGGVHAVVTSSGHFAEFAAISVIAGAGDEIVSSSRLYGGSVNLFTYFLGNLGVKVNIVDQYDLEAVEKAINEKTKALFIETISNPSCDIADFEAWSAIAKKHKLPLIADSTQATPLLCRPKDFGADIVIHSLTKYIGGHANSMGGVVIDLGTFDWAGSGRFPSFTEPNPSYHGLKFAETFGAAAFGVKVRVEALRDAGGCLSPQNSFYILQGIETLHLRIKAHSENALSLAQFLQEHEKVEWVNYPALPGSPNKARADKYLKGSGSGVLSFGV